MAKNNKEQKNILSYPAEVLEPVRSFLVDKLFHLEKKKKEIEAEDPFNDKSRLDDNASIDDDAAEQIGHMQTSALKQTVDRSMIQIKKALSRIKVGSYGICERCGKMIDTDRLMVVPETTVCVDCEKKKEK